MTAPTVPTTPDTSRRRLRLHHDLVRRRRWSDALDWLLGDEQDIDIVEVDYDACGLTLGMEERNHRGREMLGRTP